MALSALILPVLVIALLLVLVITYLLIEKWINNNFRIKPGSKVRGRVNKPKLRLVASIPYNTRQVFYPTLPTDITPLCASDLMKKIRDRPIRWSEWPKGQYVIPLYHKPKTTLFYAEKYLGRGKPYYTFCEFVPVNNKGAPRKGQWEWLHVT